MEKLFSPRSIAFIGASNSMSKWGGIVLHNLKAGGYDGEVYPVHPREKEVHGYKAYASLAEVPGEVDLAILSIPASAIPGVLEDCVNKRIPAGVVISAGFAELGEEGHRLQEEMVRIARGGDMVLVGPNGQGLSVPASRLHPWFPVFKPEPGAVGIASQSGNVSTSLAEQLGEFGFGCSKVVSAGNCADLSWDDYLEYFRSDPATKVIVLYIEGLNHENFFKAAKRASLEKPVVIFKSGRSDAGTRAAASHTGVLAGSDSVFDSACRQAGLVRAQTLEEAVITAASFVSTPLPAGRRVGFITGGGGYGVIAADAAARAGLDVVRLSERTIDKLREHLPPWWAPNNPVDMVAGLRYGGPRELVPILMESGEVDGVILLGVGWIYSMIDSISFETDFRNPGAELEGRLNRDVEYCGLMAEYFHRWGKPLIMTSAVARLAVRRGYPGLLKILGRGIMLYPTIEDSVRTFSALADRRGFLEREGVLTE
jgi:acetyltransferase